MKFVRPMMAHKWEERRDHLLDGDEYIAEAKLDGHRVHVFRDGDWIRVVSRLCKAIDPGWWYRLPLAEGDYIDGELIVADIDACTCEGLEKQGAPLVSHFRVSHPDALRLVVFDMLYYGGESIMDKPYTFRRAMLVWYAGFVGLVKDDRVRLAEAAKQSKRQFLKNALKRGAEGIVLKRLDSIYAPGSRSLSWIKVKPTDTYDVVFTRIVGLVARWTVRPGNVGTDGLLYPDGKESSTYKAGWVRLGYGFFDEDGQLREVGHCLTGSPESMEALIGEVGEIKAWGQHNSGALKYPQLERLRDDKAPEECVFNFREGR